MVGSKGTYALLIAGCSKGRANVPLCLLTPLYTFYTFWLEHQAIQHIFVGFDDSQMIAIGVVDAHEPLGHRVVAR